MDTSKAKIALEVFILEIKSMSKLIKRLAPRLYDDNDTANYWLPGVEVVGIWGTTLDIQTAEEYLRLPKVPWDRPLDESHVTRLDEQLEKDRFFAQLVTLVVANIRGEEVLYRLNGQHTATVIVRQEHSPADEGTYPDNQEQHPVRKRPFSLAVNVIHCEVDNERALRNLYSIIDMGKFRGKGDILRAFLAHGIELTRKERSAINLVSSGFTFYHWENARDQRVTGEDVAELLNGDFKTLYEHVFRFILSMKGRHAQYLKRAPVIAALFSVFEVAPDEGANFFRRVVNGTGFKENDPGLFLRDYLASVKLGNSGNVERETLFRICIVAWNFHCESRQISSLRNIQKEISTSTRPEVKTLRRVKRRGTTSN